MAKYYLQKNGLNVENPIDLVFGNNTLMRTEVKEVENNYVFNIELPGFKKEDIKISVEDKYLIVSANRNELKEEEKNQYIRRERHFGNVTRKYYVGRVSQEEINANYNNGVLIITYPKEPKQESKKYITIE